MQFPCRLSRSITCFCSIQNFVDPRIEQLAGKNAQYSRLTVLRNKLPAGLLR
jgi:hypothetical protein